MTTTPLELLEKWILRQASDGRDWFSDAVNSMKTERDLHIVLGFIPRRIGKEDLTLGEDDLSEAAASRADWTPKGWSVDGAARVIALLKFKSSRQFSEVFKDLRRTSDVAEMIALYRGLPLYPEPHSLHFEVGEGLRSNLNPVFKAIAHNNPFPQDYFDDHRWNHMILKALFVNAELAPIVGLDKRANIELARILIDYSQERWAAGRPVTSELWRPVAPFADHADIVPRIEQVKAAGQEIPL